MSKKFKRLWVEEKTHRLLKELSAHEGMSIKDYVAKKLINDSNHFINDTEKKTRKRFKGVF